jgi:hypothetical protein
MVRIHNVALAMPLLSALIIATTLATGCRPAGKISGNDGAEIQSNGPLKSLSSRRALVTGHLVVIGGKGCKVPMTSNTIEVQGCESMPICSATIVRDNAVSAKPFILSAAHCFDEDLKNYDQLDCKIRKEPLDSRRTYGLFFYSQASKKLLRLERPVIHPEYISRSHQRAFAASKAEPYPDIAVVNIATEEIGRVTDAASIEKNVPQIVPESSLLTKLRDDVEGNSQKNDRLTHFVTTFPLSAFDKSPVAELMGGGMINNRTGESISTIPASQSDCLANDLSWTPLGCIAEGRTGLENIGSLLRSVKMKIAYSSVDQGFVVFVPRKEFPMEGTCQGDSGGPAFIGENDSTAVFAVESKGPPPCAGAPTIRTIVATHSTTLGAMVQRGFQPPSACR